MIDKKYIAIIEQLKKVESGELKGITFEHNQKTDTWYKTELAKTTKI